MTVVAHSLAERSGTGLLQHYYLAALGSMVSCQLQVLVQHPWSLLEVLEW